MLFSVVVIGMIVVVRGSATRRSWFTARAAATAAESRRQLHPARILTAWAARTAAHAPLETARELSDRHGVGLPRRPRTRSSIAIHAKGHYVITRSRTTVRAHAQEATSESGRTHGRQSLPGGRIACLDSRSNRSRSMHSHRIRSAMTCDEPHVMNQCWCGRSTSAMSASWSKQSNAIAVRGIVPLRTRNASLSCGKCLATRAAYCSRLLR